MTRKNKTPKFPNSYTGSKAEEYDTLIWMERNQKRTAETTIGYLFDDKLGTDLQDDKPYLILDLGCGTGFSSEVLIENGYRVIGVDVLNDMLLKAKKKKFKFKYKYFELILADINFLPIRTNSIDHIISISAYNFITHKYINPKEMKKIMNNTAKYLNKTLKWDGRIVIEFYPENENQLENFIKSFKSNGFDGFMVKDNPNQKSGQTFLLLKKKPEPVL